MDGARVVQKGEIVLDEVAELSVLLHVDAFLEALRHEVEVNAETAGQVDQGTFVPTICLVCGGDFVLSCQQALHQLLLVAGCLLAGALLHVQMRRIDDTFHSGPRGQFLAGRLPTGNLLQGHRKVYISLLRPLQRQLPHVVIGVLSDELPSILVD